MKYWLEGILEQEDGDKQCSKCRVWQSAPSPVFQEFQIREGGMPHPDELHTDPTGLFMCQECGKMTLH